MTTSIDTDALMLETAADFGRRFGLEYWLERDTEHAFADDFYRALGEEGWLGATIPEQWGGAGLGMRVAAHVVEQVSAGGGGSTAGQYFMAAMLPAASIFRSGTDEQRERLLPKVADGTHFFGIALTEPDAGSDALSTATRADKVDGGWRITGQKIYISALERADRLQVLARATTPEAESGRGKGLTLFVVDPKADGVEWSAMPKLGTQTISTAMLYLDGVFVPDEDVLGGVGDGWKILVDSLNVERIITTASAIGAGELAIRLGAEYATNRVVFGKPIGANQAIAHPFAHAKAELAAARLLNLEAASLFDQGLPCAAEGNMAKLVGTEACFKACDHAVQTFGGAGYMQEQHVERLWRDARLWKIAPVSSEMVLSFVAQHVIGLPRSY